MPLSEWEKEAIDSAIKAKARLVELMQPDWRSLWVVYEGGHDEGHLQGVYVSKEACTEEELTDGLPYGDDNLGNWQALDEGKPDRHEMVDDVWTFVKAERTPEQERAREIADCAWPLVSRKWYGFAFEGEVRGIIVFDAITGLVERRDEVSISQYESESETF